MACLKLLKTDGLNGAQASGGTWYFRGLVQIQVDITGQPNPVTLNPGDQVPGGDDPEIDIASITGLTPGIYTDIFEYVEPNAGNCAGSFVTLNIFDAPCSGQAPDPSPSYCVGDAPFNLYDLLLNCANGDTPSTTGNWSVVIGDPIGFNLSNDNNGTNDTFDPSAPGVVAETKTVRYTVPDPSSGQAGPGCTTCGVQTTDLVIVINEAFNPGSNGSISGCI